MCFYGTTYGFGMVLWPVLGLLTVGVVVYVATRLAHGPRASH